MGAAETDRRYFVDGRAGLPETRRFLDLRDEFQTPARCAISVPYAPIPYALTRFVSIPEQIAPVRAWLWVSD